MIAGSGLFVLSDVQEANLNEQQSTPYTLRSVGILIHCLLWKNC